MEWLLLAMKATAELLVLMNGTAAQAAAEGRDPTPEELDLIRQKRQSAEAEFDSRFGPGGQ